MLFTWVCYKGTQVRESCCAMCLFSVYNGFLAVLEEEKYCSVLYVQYIVWINLSIILNFFVSTDVESSFKQELASYEFVWPRLHQQGRWRRDTSTKSSLVSEPILDNDGIILRLFLLILRKIVSAFLFIGPKINRLPQFFLDAAGIMSVCVNRLFAAHSTNCSPFQLNHQPNFLLGWPHGKSNVFPSRIWQGICLRCRTKPVSLIPLYCLERVYTVKVHCINFRDIFHMYKLSLFIGLSKFYFCSTEFCCLPITCQGTSMRTVGKLLGRMRFVRPFYRINLIRVIS